MEYHSPENVNSADLFELIANASSNEVADEAPSPENGVGQRRRDPTADAEAFGRLPDEWARDPKISPEALCILAYRCTFADEKSKFGLSRGGLAEKPLLRSGFGRDVRERAISEAVKSGRLRRTVRRARGHPDHGGWYSEAVDKLALPDDLSTTNSRLVYRGWFDGSMSCPEMATLFYMRAGTGKGPEVYTREITERFGWCRQTSHKVLGAVERCGLIEKIEQRDERGRKAGVTYRARHDLHSKLPAPAIKPEATNSATVKNSGDGKITAVKNPGDDITGDGGGGHIRIALPNGDVLRVSPSSLCPSRKILGCDTLPRSSGVGEAPRNDVSFNKGEIQPLVPERIILKNWKTSDYFRVEHEWCFNGKAKPPLDHDKWNYWLDQFGGAPAHLRTPQAHRHASEIAHELSAVGDEVGDVSIRPALAMVGLAYQVCCDHESGKSIHSLALSAERLMRWTKQGDADWAYDVPPPATKAFDEAHSLANKIANAIDTFDYGIAINRQELLSTYRLEALSRMIAQHSRQCVVDAVNHVTSNESMPPEGRFICGWGWFEPYIEAARAPKAAAAAPEPAPPRRALPFNTLEIIQHADTERFIAPSLIAKGNISLNGWLMAMAAQNRCEPAEVLDAVVDVLQDAALGKLGSREETVRLIVAGSSTNARKRVTQWCFLRQVVEEKLTGRRERKAAC